MELADFAHILTDLFHTREPTIDFVCCVNGNKDTGYLIVHVLRPGAT